MQRRAGAVPGGVLFATSTLQTPIQRKIHLILENLSKGTEGYAV
jgi:hypothetical protein